MVEISDDSRNLTGVRQAGGSVSCTARSSSGRNRNSPGASGTSLAPSSAPPAGGGKRRGPQPPSPPGAVVAPPLLAALPPLVGASPARALVPRPPSAAAGNLGSQADEVGG